MIYCNTCGNALDEKGICSECGPRASTVSVRPSPSVQQFGSSAAAATAPALDPSVAHQQANAPYVAQPAETLTPGPHARTQTPSAIPKGVVVMLAGLGIVVVVLAIYFSARPGSSRSLPRTAGGASADEGLAASLNSAIDHGRLVNPVGDDAYTYFTRLAATNSQHPALANAKTKVVPQLRSLGEEFVNRKVNHSGEVSEQDWMTFVRAYEWVHSLEPGDKTLEARQKYAQGKLAEAQGRRSDAWQAFFAATQLDPSWAVPQNDLGFWTTQDASQAKQKWSKSIPYYERAIALQDGWEIPYNNLGTAYFYLGNLDRAEGYYRQAIQRNTNWARPHKWLGDIYKARNDPSSALREYQAAIDLYNPNTDSLRLDLIQNEINRLHSMGY